MRPSLSRRNLMLNAAALSGLAACGGEAAQAPVLSTASPHDALGDMDATGIASHIRSGEISAREAVDAAIVRIERLDPQLNFMASKLYDEARARAALPTSGPFGGVPTLIKDLLPLSGAPLKFGSRAFANYIAPEQPPYTDAVLAAGVIPLGKSTTPEFGLTATTEPLLTGETRNPWDSSRSSGGSSGGAAVAVATGAVPIAHASDGGGSIRIPASCNGLFGLKASRDRLIPSERAQLISIAVDGCLSRSVRDTAAWLAATERSDAAAPHRAIGFVTGPSERRLRIGLRIEDARGREPHANVRAAIEDAADACRGLGHTITPIDLPFDGEAFENAFIMIWASGAAEIVAMVSQNAPNASLDTLLEPLTLGLAAQYRAAPADALEQAIGVFRRTEAQYHALFADIDVLLTPVLAQPPLRLGEIAPTLPMEIGFARVQQYVAYTPLQNAAGAPAMSVPLGMSRDGLPIGAHFSAPQGEDRRLLELAYELELARPWAGRRPGIHA